jgi:hypothetical protein
MFPRRIGLAAIAAVLILAAGVQPASTASPATSARVAERPLTPEEQAASDRKIARALRYLASARARSFGLAPLACATPEAELRGAGTGSTRDPFTTADCDVPSDFLGVSARDQIRGHYCGPAVGQVIANYTWAVPLDVNKYSQTKIAGWMRTDELGGTSAFTMADGLDTATAGAPRRPADWDWVVTALKDTDGDGTVGDQLHDYVRANISGSRMALAIPVLPYEKDGRFHLSSWAHPVSSPGHWIGAYGWRGLFDGTDSARLYYTDSSEDEGGSTGRFWDPIRHIGGMIRDHTQRFVW